MQIPRDFAATAPEEMGLLELKIEFTAKCQK
jgi:hypothetical protein